MEVQGVEAESLCDENLLFGKSGRGPKAVDGPKSPN